MQGRQRVMKEMLMECFVIFDLFKKYLKIRILALWDVCVSTYLYVGTVILFFMFLFYLRSDSNYKQMRGIVSFTVVTLSVNWKTLVNLYYEYFFFNSVNTFTDEICLINTYNDTFSKTLIKTNAVFFKTLEGYLTFLFRPNLK